MRDIVQRGSQIGVNVEVSEAFIERQYEVSVELLRCIAALVILRSVVRTVVKIHHILPVLVVVHVQTYAPRELQIVGKRQCGAGLTHQTVANVFAAVLTHNHTVGIRIGI